MAASYQQHSLSKLNTNLYPPASPASSVDSDPGYGTLDFPKKVTQLSILTCSSNLAGVQWHWIYVANCSLIVVVKVLSFSDAV